MKVVKHWNRLPRGDRWPIPGNTQDQVGWGSKQSDLVEDDPAHCRGAGLDGLWRALSTWTTLWFYVAQTCKKLSTKSTTPAEISGHLFCSQALRQGTTLIRNICPQNVTAADCVSCHFWTSRTWGNNTHPPQWWSGGWACSEIPGGKKQWEKRSRSRSENSSQKTQKMPLKTEQTN